MIKGKLNILIAFPYFKKDLQEFLTNEVDRSEFNLIVDSGAFTAWNIGKDIKLDDYCTFLDSIEHLRPFHAVQLDVFGDPEASWKNYLIMKERGYDVMPVFTRGESLDMLEEMYKYTDYIMFGGVVIGRGNRNYVKWFLERNNQRDTHWLGFVNMPFIKTYKPRSVDSSSWMMASRFGSMSLYSGAGEIKTFKKLQFANSPTEEMLRCAKKTLLSPDELKILAYKDAWIFNGHHDGNIDWRKPDKRSSAQFIGNMGHIMRAWEVEEKVGTKIYFAVGTHQMLRILFMSKRFLDQRR